MCIHYWNCVHFSCIQLITNVRLSSPPFPVMNEENMEKLKVVMSSRYDPSVKTLDLAALYEDKNLQQEGLFLPLNRPVIATCVGKIIQQHIPEVSPFSSVYSQVHQGLTKHHVQNNVFVLFNRLGASVNKMCNV